ncbi:hypothetical protein JCM10207_000061 [Rhodosporidiobolus poonsookiae]
MRQKNAYKRWTTQETRKLCKAVYHLGEEWPLIETTLGGRSASAYANRWRAVKDTEGKKIKRQLKQKEKAKRRRREEEEAAGVQVQEASAATVNPWTAQDDAALLKFASVTGKTDFAGARAHFGKARSKVEIKHRILYLLRLEKNRIKQEEEEESIATLIADVGKLSSDSEPDDGDDDDRSLASTSAAAKSKGKGKATTTSREKGRGKQRAAPSRSPSLSPSPPPYEAVTKAEFTALATKVQGIE